MSCTSIGNQLVLYFGYLSLLLLSTDAKKISIWRYQDPSLGPRKIPSCDDLEKGKTQLTEAHTFKVDVIKQTTIIEENGNQFEIGSSLVYIVAP